MGTRLEIVLPGVDEEQADMFVSLIRKELSRIESIINNYREDSIFSRINELAFEKLVKTDPETLELVSNLIEYHHKAREYFDFTLWKLSAGKIRDEDKEEFISLDLDRKIVLDREDRAIRFLNRNVGLDSGSFGKGMALDSIKKIMNSNKIKNGFISFGGSSVLAQGNHPAGDHWPVGIRDFREENRNIHVFKMKDSILSTSGNNLNNRNRYPEGHIIDPRTGNKIDGLRQVSVYGESGLISEILSTALFIAPEEDIQSILENFEGYRAVIFSFGPGSDHTIIKEF